MLPNELVCYAAALVALSARVSDLQACRNARSNMPQYVYSILHEGLDSQTRCP